MATRTDDRQQVSVSIFRKRLRKFRKIKRGYYSFVILLTLYAVSFLLPVLVNNKAIVVRYEGKTYWPLLHFYPSTTFGLDSGEEPDYRELRATLAENGRGFALMPPYPFHPNESLLDLPGEPPDHPSRAVGPARSTVCGIILDVHTR